MVIKKDTLYAKGIEISIYTEDFRNEYISLTDIAKYRNADDPRYVIQNWMRNRDTVEFLGLWEMLHNANFNRVQFDAVKSEAGSNRFVMTPTKWVELTNAQGIICKSGRYGGGTFAHREELRKVALEQLQTLSALNLSTLPDLPMLPNPNK